MRSILLHGLCNQFYLIHVGHGSPRTLLYLRTVLKTNIRPYGKRCDCNSTNCISSSLRLLMDTDSGDPSIPWTSTLPYSLNGFSCVDLRYRDISPRPLPPHLYSGPSRRWGWGVEGVQTKVTDGQDLPRHVSWCSPNNSRR